MTDDIHGPYSLSDLFDRSARHVGRTFVRSLAVGALTMIPGGMVFGFVLRELFAGIADAVQIHSEGASDLRMFQPVLYAAGEFGVGIVLFGVASLTMLAAVMHLTEASLRDTPCSWQEAFARGWHAMPRLLLQMLVMIAVAGVCIAIPFLFIIADSYVAGILLFIAAACILLWLFTGWSMSVAAVVGEDTSAIGGLARSAAVVRHRWWRTFGILLLFGLLTGFGVNIVMTPLQAYSMSGLFAQFQSLGDLSSHDSRLQVDTMLQTLMQAGWMMGVVAGISEILSTAIQGVYTILLFHDLRARHARDTEALQG